MDTENNTEEKGASKKKIAFWICTGLIPIFLIFFGYSWIVDSVGPARFEEMRGFMNDRMPLWADLIFIFLVECCLIPATPMLVFPMIAEYAWWIAIPLSGIAAALGGMTAYWIGRAIEKIPFVSRLTDKAYAKWGPTIRRYGIGFVWVSAIFPLPFSWICMASGVMELPWKKVWPTTTTRIIRMAIYYSMFVL